MNVHIFHLLFIFFDRPHKVEIFLKSKNIMGQQKSKLVELRKCLKRNDPTLTQLDLGSE
jgi:hypothetical protein